MVVLVVLLVELLVVLLAVVAAVVLLFLLLLPEPDVFRRSARKLANCFRANEVRIGRSGGPAGAQG